MNLPIWAILIAPPVIFVLGFLVCAMFTAGKAGDEQTALAEHARLADACLAKQARIDRALACETPKAAHGVKKMARLLRGEEA